MGRFKKYSHKEKGFLITCPKDWEMFEEVMGIDLLIRGPFDEKFPDSRPSLTLSVQDLSSMPALMHLEPYTGFSKGQIMGLVDGLNIEREQDCVIDGRTGLDIVYSGIRQDLQLEIKAWQQWTIKESYAYVLTYTAIPAQFEPQIETAKVVFESFRFL